MTGSVCSVAQYPYVNLHFPKREKSVANALYSSIELSLATFPHEIVKSEVKEMKKRILTESRDQVLKDHPNAEFTYNISDIAENIRRKKTRFSRGIGS